MKNLVNAMLGLVFFVVGCNIANIVGYDPPSNLQTVAASTVTQQNVNHLFDNIKHNEKTNPEVVHDTVHVQTPCNHKLQPVKTVVKNIVKSKKDTLYVPLLFIATPVEGDSVDYAYNVHHVSK